MTPAAGRDPRSGWPPDRQTIDRARQGDRQALGEILGIAFPKLVAFYRGMGLPKEEAEDVASEAIEGIVRNIGRLRELDAFEGWMWAVARNRVRTTLRRRSRVMYEKGHQAEDDPSDLAVMSDEHRHIRAALLLLSPRDRQVLWLREVEELSHEEIAGRLGLGVGAVRVAALRARRRLEEIYTKSHPVRE